KKGNLLFVVEDITGTLKCIIHQSKIELVDRAQRILLDQVIGVEGRVTKNGFMFVSNIFWPDVPLVHPRPVRAEEPVSAALISDLHVGSRECMEDVIRRFILWLQGRVGGSRDRQIAGRIKYIVIAGDLVDGIGVYPGQEQDLIIKDVREQYQRVAELLRDIPEYIEIVAIPGNHDAVRQALPQPAIPKRFGEPLYSIDQLRLLGNPCYLQLHGVELAVLHGNALNDIVQMLPGVDYSNPQKAMEAIIKSRHIAPTYGAGTLLAPEPKDWLVLDRVPHIVHAGHIHINSISTYRDILLVNSGTFQEQTDYMRMSGIKPTPGEVPIVDLDTLKVCQLSFTM
ncbi:MAG: metallophosphoesterase, partial [Candidatus Ranarchaeia archaeon]